MRGVRLEATLDAENGCALVFNGSGTRLASGGARGNVDVWDWAARGQHRHRPLYSFAAHHYSLVRAVAVLPSNTTIASIDGLDNVALSEVDATGALVSHKLLVQRARASLLGLPKVGESQFELYEALQLALDPINEHVFLSSGVDGCVRIYDVRTQTMMQT